MGNRAFRQFLVLIGVAPFAIFMSEFQMLKRGGEMGALLDHGTVPGRRRHRVCRGARARHRHGVGRTRPDAEAGAREQVEKLLVAFAPLAVLLVLGLWMPAASADASCKLPRTLWKAHR